MLRATDGLKGKFSVYLEDEIYFDDPSECIRMNTFR